jgi:hypothetical protein
MELHTSFWDTKYLAEQIAYITGIPADMTDIIVTYNHRNRDRGTERQELRYARHMIGMCNQNHHCSEAGCRNGRVQHVNELECEFIHEPRVICAACEAYWDGRADDYDDYDSYDDYF